MSARLVTFTLVVLALVAAGCGGDDEGKPIPARSASALNAQLDNVQGRLDNGSAGACQDILEGPRGPNLQQVNQIIESLPDDVDPDVRSALQDSFDNLWDRVQAKCDDLAQKQEEEQPPTEAQPTPTETQTTPTETTPTETTPTETTPPQDEQLPPGEGDGNGGGATGNGNGNGNGTGGESGGSGGISPDDLGGGE